MKHIKGFYELNEALLQGGWNFSEWKQMPEWQILQDMGFTDTTTPLQAKNETIMVKPPVGIPLYPAGIVLQKSGYIRDKAASSGFIKTYNQPRSYTYSIKIMFDYLIDRFSKEASKRTRKPEHGDLSDEAINYIANCVSTDKWVLNPETNRIDVQGGVSILGNNYNEDILNTIRFGVIKGNFTIRNNEASNLSFAPSLVKGNFECSSTEIESLEGCPERVNGSFICSNNSELYSLEGSPRYVGKDLDLRGCRRIPNLIGGPDYVGGTVCLIGTRMESLDGFPKGAKNLYYYRDTDYHNKIDINWNMEGWLEGLKKYPELFVPLLDDAQKIYDVIKENPVDLSKIYKILKPGVQKEIEIMSGLDRETIETIGDMHGMGLI